MDADTHKDPQDQLYPVLNRILSILRREQYEFVGLSIGPEIPVEDDDVNPWTSLLDAELSTGKMLATIAAGNSGEANAALRLNRIQPPGDSVNGYVVGSCDHSIILWRRADYSSVGPSRSPGRRKPDGVAPGGTEDSPFFALNDVNPPQACGVCGTSFAAPNVLRAALGVRAVLGSAIGPLALKAMLTHSSDPGSHDPSEVGWGRICTDLNDLITCPPGTAHVIYQGYLHPKKFVRAAIPMPPGEVPGDVTIKATICIATETDPQDPIHYTRSGLEILFRRDRSKIKPGKSTADTTPFFGEESGMDETELRDANKWETTRHASRRMSGDTLRAPVFDIHYNPRAGGRDARDAKSIPYAMIITVDAPEVNDLYDRVLNRYRHQLEPLRPVIQIPLRVNRGGAS